MKNYTIEGIEIVWYGCAICGKKYKTWEELMEHQEIHEKNKPKEQE